MHEFKTLKFKSDGYKEDEGIFSGYAAVFGNVDSGGDLIEPGAFKKSLENGIERVKILSNHNECELPIGKPLEIREDENGLFIKAKIIDTAIGRDVKALLKEGVLNELSIGYDPVDFDYDDDKIRHLKEINLWEVSVVTWAMNPKATVTNYKNLQEGDTEMFVESKAKKAQEDGNEDDIMQKLMKMIGEKRKGLGTDESLPISPEEIAEALAEILEGEEENQKNDGENDEEKAGENEDEEQKNDGGENEDGQKKAPSKIKNTKSKQHNPSQISRKYTNLFFTAPTTKINARKGKQSPYADFGRAIKCLDIHGKGDPDRAAYYANKLYGDSEMASEFKAQSVTSPSAGGYLVPEIYYDQIIELLYSQTVIFELGAQKISMPNGNLNIPRMTSGARAHWIGENRPMQKTKHEYGSLKLSAKKLAALLVESREISMSSNFSSDDRFGRDLVMQIQRELERTTLFGEGTSFQPMGIAKMKEVEKIDLSKIDDANLAIDGTPQNDLPVFINSKVLSKNVDPSNLGWVFNSRVEQMFKTMKTTTGAYIYREEMMQNQTLDGYKYRITNEIKTDDKGASSLFFGNWGDLLVGEQAGLETYTTLDGGYTDDNGDHHFLAQEWQSMTTAVTLIDIGVRHPESFIVVNNIKVLGGKI